MVVLVRIRVVVVELQHLPVVRSLTVLPLDGYVAAHDRPGEMLYWMPRIFDALLFQQTHRVLQGYEQPTRRLVLSVPLDEHPQGVEGGPWASPCDLCKDEVVVIHVDDLVAHDRVRGQPAPLLAEVVVFRLMYGEVGDMLHAVRVHPLGESGGDHEHLAVWQVLERAQGVP